MTGYSWSDRRAEAFAFSPFRLVLPPPPPPAPQVPPDRRRLGRGGGKKSLAGDVGKLFECPARTEAQ